MNSSEAAEVLTAISQSRGSGQRMALATIVAIRGSTYRRPGARYLVFDEGEPIGNLSGGCLEGEVEQVAREAMDLGTSRLEHYDLTAEDEVVWGWGLGCNGAIEVFVEPADKAVEIADALRFAIEEERPLTIATVIEPGAGIDPGARLLVHPNGRREGRLGDAQAEATIAQAAELALRTGVTEARTLEVRGDKLRVFFETLVPPLRLLVCGAGHDAIPVVKLGSELGWKSIVVDDREDFLTPERFPQADDFVLTAPEVVTQAAEVNERTYVVVMTHNYLRDLAYLKSFLSSNARYIGMLGPRERLERLLGDLKREGVELTPEDEERIHGPAGLDIGGEGPEEIAVAIISQVLAVANHRPAGFLRDKKGPIHESPEAIAR